MKTSNEIAITLAMHTHLCFLVTVGAPLIVYVEQEVEQQE